MKALIYVFVLVMDFFPHVSLDSVENFKEVTVKFDKQVVGVEAGTSVVFQGKVVGSVVEVHGGGAFSATMTESLRLQVLDSLGNLPKGTIALLNTRLLSARKPNPVVVELIAPSAAEEGISNGAGHASGRTTLLGFTSFESYWSSRLS